MGADAHVFHAEPAPIAHSLMPSPLLLTQTGDNPIGVRGTGGAPTMVAEFPREKKLGLSPDWARDVRGLLEITVLPQWDTQITDPQRKPRIHRAGRDPSPPHPHRPDKATLGQGARHQVIERQLRRAGAALIRIPCVSVFLPLPFPPPLLLHLPRLSLPAPLSPSFCLSLSLSLFLSFSLPLSLSLSLTHIAHVHTHTTHRHTPLDWAVNLTRLTTSHPPGDRQKYMHEGPTVTPSQKARESSLRLVLRKLEHHKIHNYLHLLLNKRDNT